MPTNFLDSAGTNGFLTAPFSLLTTELNALASGSAATSSVGGTSGVFNQTNFAQGMWGLLWFTAGGAFTPVLGAALSGWFLQSPNGGTTFESLVAAPSTTVAALSRAPDFVLPLDNASYTAGNIRFAPSFFKLPWPSCKIVLQNNSGVVLPSTGNILTVGPVATQY